MSEGIGRETRLARWRGEIENPFNPMPPTEAEYEELRSRVELLEKQVAEFSGRIQQPALPPVLKPPPPVPVRAGPKGKSIEISSTAWVAGIGAVIFLVGAIYGLTVAIQRGWISPPMRVAAGLIVGLVVGIGAARRLRASAYASGVALLAAGVGTWSFALYFGARQAELFPLWVGFDGTTLAVVLAGLLGARVRCDGALAVALATGLVAPLAFSSGAANLPVLLAHLMMLSSAQLAVHYLTGAGADWKWSRTLGVAGVWFVTWGGVTDGSLQFGAVWILELLFLLGTLGLMLAWLPRHREKPLGAGAATAVVMLMFAMCTWIIWGRAGLAKEAYALVLAGLSGLSLAFIGPARRRTGGNQHDTLLLLLAAGFALLALPVALDWRWVGIGWGVLALGIAQAARLADRDGRALRDALILAAGLTATAASSIGLARAWDQGPADWPVVNPVFMGAMFAAAAWGTLVLITGRHRTLAFLAMQFVAVNLVAWELHRVLPDVRSENATLALGSLLATLTYAVAGAGQWLRGVIREGADESARALRMAGYCWLTVASAKLLINDLAGADLLFRAAAALGMGSVLLIAAIWADRQRKASLPPKII